MTATLPTVDLKLHDLARTMPPMTSGEFENLCTDISRNGIVEPLLVWHGHVLDGRHRLDVARRLGLPTVPVREWNGTMSDALSLVASLNLARRHLDTSQRAMVAARLKPLFEAEARARQQAGVRATGPEGGRRAREVAAQAAGSSGRSVARAEVVLARGTPELAAAVDARHVAVAVAAKIAKLPAEGQRAVLAQAGGDPARAKHALRVHVRGEQLAAISLANAPLPIGEKRYSLILADPPWRYHDDLSNPRAVENHYPTLTLEEICALPVGGLCAPDAVLFLWTTAPKALDAADVIRAWGFEYKSQAVWMKDRIGVGSYFRIQHELLLVATRGETLTPAERDRVSSVLAYPRGNHSAKPPEVYDLIERMYPGAARIELFARGRRPGWSAWGNEVGGAP